MLALTVVVAVLLDGWWGEPRRWHPLVGFGYLADRVESGLRRAPLTTGWLRVRGGLGVAVLVLPCMLLTAWLAGLTDIGWLIDVLALYLALGYRSLMQHAQPVIDALNDDDEREARRRAAMLVSRDAAQLNIKQATIESVLENGSDSVFAALFWFLLAGASGVVMYRLVNTLDAMWGYRSPRYRYFGWAAARLDDLLNYLPARLTALSYALLGNTLNALQCWREQAPLHDSPNAGPVMAAGAGSLGIVLGGAAVYRGELHQRPLLGMGSAPQLADIGRAMALVRQTLLLWLSVLCAGQLLLWSLANA